MIEQVRCLRCPIHARRDRRCEVQEVDHVEKMIFLSPRTAFFVQQEVKADELRVKAKARERQEMEEEQERERLIADLQSLASAQEQNAAATVRSHGDGWVYVKRRSVCSRSIMPAISETSTAQEGYYSRAKRL